MNLYLGVIRKQDGTVVNHRSLLKILLNPFLSLVGLCIATKFDKGKPKGLTFITGKPYWRGLSFKYDLEDNYVEKIRRLI